MDVLRGSELSLEIKELKVTNKGVCWKSRSEQVSRIRDRKVFHLKEVSLGSFIKQQKFEACISGTH